MNFTGQYRRPKSINLGGRASASRESVLQRAKADREKRERQRLEEQACRSIQRFYRARKNIESLRMQVLHEWDEAYSSPSALVPKLSAKELYRMLTQVSFTRELFFKDTRYSGGQVTRLEVLYQLLIENKQYLDQIDGGCLGRLLDEFSIVLLSFDEYPNSIAPVLSIILLMSPYKVQDLNRAYGKLWSYAKHCNIEVQKLFFECIRVTALKNGTSFIVNILSKGKEALEIFNSVFSDEDNPILSAVRVGQQSLEPEELLIMEKSPVMTQEWRQRSQLKLGEELTILNAEEKLNILSAAMYTLEGVVLTPEYFTFLTSILSCFTNIRLTSKSHMAQNAEYEPSNSEESDIDDQVVTFYNEFQHRGIEKLYNSAFYESVFRQVIRYSRKSSSAVPLLLNKVADFFSALVQLYPEKSSQIVLALIAMPGEDDDRTRAIPILWDALRTTRIYEVLDDHAKLPTVDEFSDIFISSQTNWPVLKLMLKLMQYWLIVVDDQEFFEKAKIGLPPKETSKFTEFLKNWSFCIIWYWQRLKLLVGKNFYNLKNLSILVLRQLYIRDSRRSFLRPEFWLMFSKAELSTFMPTLVTNESERLQIDNYEQIGPSNLSIDDDDDRKSHSSDPRVEIINSVPFFMPFTTRVKILQEFIKLSKANSGYRFDRFPGYGNIIKIRRNHILEDGYLAFERLGSEYKNSITVAFYDQHGELEAGIDGGGLTKEFITTVCQEGFNPLVGLFASNNDHLLYPEPLIGLPPSLSHVADDQRDQQLTYLNFLGKVIGKSLYEGIQINVEFAPFFLLKWTGRQSRNSFDDLYSLDPELYENLVKVQEYPGDVENDLNLDFTIMQDIGSDRQVLIKLKPNGSEIAVTNKNRLEYISAIANYKLNTVLSPQTRAFLNGVHDLIEPHWLSMFNANEIQLLISGGTSKIDISDLMANCVYSGIYDEKSPLIVNFWEVVEEMSEREKQNLVKFVTSVPKAPLLGFSQLKPLFCIRDTGNETGRLPTASTCFNLLKLPNYESKQILQNRLLYAINSGAGFDLS